jgi:hypothetical protein
MPGQDSTPYPPFWTQWWVRHYAIRAAPNRVICAFARPGHQTGPSC